MPGGAPSEKNMGRDNNVDKLPPIPKEWVLQFVQFLTMTSELGCFYELRTPTDLDKFLLDFQAARARQKLDYNILGASLEYPCRSVASPIIHNLAKLIIEHRSRKNKLLSIRSILWVLHFEYKDLKLPQLSLEPYYFLLEVDEAEVRRHYHACVLTADGHESLPLDLRQVLCHIDRTIYKDAAIPSTAKMELYAPTEKGRNKDLRQSLAEDIKFKKVTSPWKAGVDAVSKIKASHDDDDSRIDEEDDHSSIDEDVDVDEEDGDSSIDEEDDGVEEEDDDDDNDVSDGDGNDNCNDDDDDVNDDDSHYTDVINSLFNGFVYKHDSRNFEDVDSDGEGGVSAWYRSDVKGKHMIPDVAETVEFVAREESLSECQILRVNGELVNGIFFYVTLTARMNDGPLKTYQATVYSYYRRRRILLHFGEKASARASE